MSDQNFTKNPPPFFATDSKKFYDGKTGKAITQEAVETYLLLEGVDPDNVPNEVMKIIINGKPYNEQRKPKQEKIKLGKKEDLKMRIDAAYQDLKEHIPLLFFNKAEGATFVFKRLNANEVATINTSEDKALVSSILSDDAAQEVFEQYHSESIVLQSSMTLVGFIEELITRARTDKAKRIKQEPKFITWKEGELAFKYFNPDILIDAPTPYYDEFCSRLDDNKDLFMAWIWSIFQPENNGRQMLWIKGEGQDGKSTIFNALTAFIGKHHSASISESDLLSPFFFNSVYGRILITYPDCHITDIFREEKLKNITGGDEQTINGKYAQTFKGSVYSKLLIASNQFPQVAWHLPYQSSRIIVLPIRPMKEIGKGDSRALAALIKETPAFLKKCRALYPKFFPTNSSLIVPPQWEKHMHATFISNEMAVIREFCNERLEMGEDYSCKGSAVRGELNLYFRNMELRKPKDLDLMFEKYVKSLSKKVEGPIQVPNGISTTIGFKGFKLKDPEGKKS